MNKTKQSNFRFVMVILTVLMALTSATANVETEFLQLSSSEYLHGQLGPFPLS